MHIILSISMYNSEQSKLKVSLKQSEPSGK